MTDESVPIPLKAVVDYDSLPLVIPHAIDPQGQWRKCRVRKCTCDEPELLLRTIAIHKEAARYLAIESQPVELVQTFA
jgi:hypothetical protein